MRRRLTLPFATAAALMLVGCAASTSQFPSLAPRPAERDRSMEPPVRQATEVPSDPELRRSIADLSRRAEAGARAFQAALGPTETAVRAAGAAESESWVEAQLRLSQLEAARVDTVQALGDLDRLALTRAGQATSQQDFDALQAAIEAAERLAAEQQTELDRLRARLRNG